MSIFTLNGLLVNKTGHFPHYIDRIMYIWTFHIDHTPFFLLSFFSSRYALTYRECPFFSFSSFSSSSLQSVYNLVWLTLARDNQTYCLRFSHFLLTDARRTVEILELIVVARSDAVHHYRWVLFVWSLRPASCDYCCYSYSKKKEGILINQTDALCLPDHFCTYVLGLPMNMYLKKSMT